MCSSNKTAPLVLLAPAFAGIYFSYLYLPPVGEVLPIECGRVGNFFGQGMFVSGACAASLLLTIYCLKRVLIAAFEATSVALYFYFLSFLFSLPFLWFVCEPDWFNPHLYRIACWTHPIAFWAVPTASFLLDIHTNAPIRTYLIRSGIEMLVVFPAFMIVWNFYTFFALEWGWL